MGFELTDGSNGSNDEGSNLSWVFASFGSVHAFASLRSTMTA